MFLFFNKEYRQLESIMSDVRKKIKKSGKIETGSKGDTEIYKLDTVDLHFHVVEPETFTVKDKTGQEIIFINWSYSNSDEMQQARNNRVHHLLNFVREENQNRKEKAKKLQTATETAKKVAEANKKKQSAEMAKDKMMADALNRLRGL